LIASALCWAETAAMSTMSIWISPAELNREESPVDAAKEEWTW
jgi:hypothetical protein